MLRAAAVEAQGKRAAAQLDDTYAAHASSPERAFGAAWQRERHTGPRALQPRSLVTTNAGADARTVEDSGKQSMIKRKFGTRIAALACAVRSEASADALRIASCITRWREVARAVEATEGARAQLGEVARLMRTAADGRARTHHAVRASSVRRCLRSAEALSVTHAFRFWIDAMRALEIGRQAQAYDVASTAAAAAAAEVTRLADQLAVARHSAAIRPAHLNAELKAERETATAAVAAREEAEAKTAALIKSASAAEASCASQTIERSVFTRTIALHSRRRALPRFVGPCSCEADGVHPALCGDGASLRWVWLEAWRNARSSTPRHRGLPRPMLVQPCLSRRVYRGVGTSAYSLCKSGAVWWRC